MVLNSTTLLWMIIAMLAGASACTEPASPAAKPAIPVAAPTVAAECGGTCLVVLGVAQDAGYPQANCQKKCCAPAWQHPEKAQRVVSLGLADAASQTFWIFEATPDFPQQWMHMQQLFPNYHLGGIFLSHAHIGHYTGLMYLGREVVNAPGIPVYAMPRMGKFLSENGPWSQLVSLGNIEIHPLKEEIPVALSGGLLVRPLLVPHRDEFSETVGFRIESGDKSALFIPDIDKWSKWDHSLVKEIDQVDYAFLDATFYSADELPGRDMSEIPHPMVRETISTLRQLPTIQKNKVQFIHFNHTNPLLQPHSMERDTVYRNGFQIAETGKIYPISSK